MYGALIRRQVRSGLERESRGDYGAVLKNMSADIHQVFPGDHALGGERHTRHAVEQWFERLFRLLSGLSIKPRNIVVSGLPWDTVVAVEWIATASPQDGEPYRNEGTHIMRMCWGRLVELRTYLDTEKVANTCRRLAEVGVEEAAAPPITD
jgi:ketosteroid isomerase-like protein